MLTKKKNVLQNSAPRLHQPIDLCSLTSASLGNEHYFIYFSDKTIKSHIHIHNTTNSSNITIQSTTGGWGGAV